MKVDQLILILMLATGLLCSCQKEIDLAIMSVDTPTTEQASVPLEIVWSNSDELSLGKLSYEFASNVRYGNHKRNKFDIATPNSETPTPLVIYIHGGGFTMGDKKAAYIHSDTIRKFLANNIAFATINYRYLDQSEDGVLSCLQDCKNFLQFARYYADELNVDPERIATYGPSAGGGAGLWLATSDDLADMGSEDLLQRQSTRLSAAVALGTQSTYDMVRWEEIFAPYNFMLADTMFDQQTLFDFYSINDLEQLYQPKTTDYRASVDMLRLMDAQDAPIYVQNFGKALPPKETVDLYHHPYHAHALKERATAVGLPHLITSYKTGITDERDQGPVQFLLEQFGK
ncbi:MAG: alpha/beta hydrolase [Bacteroidota bacterium]